MCRMPACCQGLYSCLITGDRKSGRNKLKTICQWIRTQIKDTTELFLLPGLAVVLPWSWSFKAFRSLARLTWLYRDDSEQALAVVQRIVGVEDPDEWLRRRKLLTLVDHADLFLARFRSHKWLDHHVDVVGNWPVGGRAALLCTFHWGAGMWSLRHARLAGMKAHSLVAPMNKANFKGRPVLWSYVKARVQNVSRELGVPTLEVSGSMRQVVRALKGQEQVLAAIDVPADTVSATVSIPMLGAHMQLPRGLLRIAAENGIAVTVFTMGLDMETGRRKLCLRQLSITTDSESLSYKVFSFLEEAVKDDTSAWHLWSQFDRFQPSN